MKQTDAVTSIARRPGRPPGGHLAIDAEAILDAAERVIERDGPGASIESVAVEAGITKPIVYARVGSRAELANALADRLASRMVEAARRALAGRTFSQASLTEFIAANLRVVLTHRDLFLYVTGGSTEQTALGRLGLAERSTTPLAAGLEQWRRAAGLDPTVAESWAFGIVGMLQMASLWVIDESSPGPDQVADHLADLLWWGMAGKPGRTT
jgi:AcrR family transcriptional regulator